MTIVLQTPVTLFLSPCLQARWDFVDHNKHETAETLQSRKQQTEEMLKNRGSPYSTPAHQAAFMLDPRCIHWVNDPAADDAFGFPFGPARQEALSTTMNHYIPKFWKSQAGGAWVTDVALSPKTGRWCNKGKQ